MERKSKKCNKCHGEGTIVVDEILLDDGDVELLHDVCEKCKGNGYIHRKVKK
jgi:DnaJ-class molecular chaperone